MRLLIVILISVEFVRAANLQYGKNLIVSKGDDYEGDQMASVLSKGIELAVKHCHLEFKHEKWNCPAKDFFAKQQNPTMDRESAFVQSITVAAIAYSVAKNCSGKDQNSFCGCAFKDKNGVLDVYECFKNMRDTENDFSQIISQLSGDGGAYDPQGIMLLQNSRAGLYTVMNSVQKTCRCHGFSGSCSISTCWMAVDSFSKIAADLKELYDKAEQLDTNNNMHMDHFVLTDGELVFLDESPNYCGKPKGAGSWKSVRGRRCATSQSTDEEIAACKNLCMDCGLRLSWRQVIAKRSCNCKFSWCCNVTCDTCEEPVQEFFCK